MDQDGLGSSLQAPTEELQSESDGPVQFLSPLLPCLSYENVFLLLSLD